jgi:RNA polymerase sigma factor (sigma-70 family)
LLEHIDTLRDEERIYGYVATIANREATALKARARLTRDKLSQLRETERSEDHDSPLPEMMLSDDIEILARAFTSLPGKCRELLRLLFWDSGNISYQEISRRLNIPISSIGPTRGRCLEKLRQKMKEFGFEE